MSQPQKCPKKLLDQVRGESIQSLGIAYDVATSLFEKRECFARSLGSGRFFRSSV